MQLMSKWGSNSMAKIRRRSPRSLKAKFERQLRQLRKQPRREIPHRREAGLRRPSFAASREFYREFLKRIMSLLHHTPDKAGPDLRLALRLSPYVDPCLAVDAWARLSFWHRIQGRLGQAERTLEVAFQLADSCEACQARLKRPLTLLRRDQGEFSEALHLADEAIAFYEQGYDESHDLEPDSFSLTLTIKAVTFHCAARPKEAASLFGWALSIVSPLESPELYESLLLNYPQSLAESDDEADLEEADRFLDHTAGHLGGLPRYSIRREYLRWVRWRIKFRLRRATSKQVERELNKTRRFFMNEKMGKEVVIITTHLAEISDVSHEDIRSLLQGLGTKKGGMLSVFPWIPVELHGAIQDLYQMACSWNWHDYQKLPDLLVDLRDAAGARTIMPI